MSILFLAATLVAIEPGPLDAFKANYSAIRVETDFTYDTTPVGGKEFIIAVNEKGRFDFVGDPVDHLDGKWSCDGRTEYYFFSSTADVIEAARKLPKVRGQRVRYVPKIEALYNGSVLAARSIDGGDKIFPGHDTTLPVWATGEPGMLSLGKGAFLWWISHPFPDIIKVHFGKAVPKYGSVEMKGNRYETEMYEKTFSNGDRLRIEILFDPSVGYLPAFARLFMHTNNSALIKEFYLVKSDHCASGGFFPSEWYDTMYSLPWPADKPVDFTSGDKLIDKASRIKLGHYATVRFSDRANEVALSHLDNVTAISSSGGDVPLPKGTASLTLTKIQSLMGKRLTNPQPLPLPPLNRPTGVRTPVPLRTASVDTAELMKYEETASRPSGWRSYATGIAAVAAGAAVFVLVRRRRKIVLVLMTVLACEGCTTRQPPLVGMTAEFERPTLTYDASQSSVPLTVVIKNSGNVPTRISKVDAGCACRRVDQSPLPSALAPGGMLRLTVHLTPPRTHLAQPVAFSITTDVGKLSAPTVVQAMPNHRVHPEAVSHTSLVDDEPWEFEVTHRIIYSVSEPKPRADLIGSDDLAVAKAGITAGDIEDIAGHKFEDSIYKVSLRNNKKGLNKSILRLVDTDNKNILDVPVTWERIPYLSHAPSHVSLGTRPIRVFLRCPDPEVELIRVKTAPHGVRAVISSVRELSFSLAADAPDVISGEVEVETSAPKRPPLIIPVVRYDRSKTKVVVPH